MCPHNAIYVSLYCCICVLVLLYMCARAIMYVSALVTRTYEGSIKGSIKAL
jgi:hypothetical protein